MWTGKSYTYWVNRWKIGDETQPIQQMIATDRLGANVPAEMSRLPPLPRAIVREGFVEGKLINTLDPRSLADEWKAIQADPTVPTRDKPKRFKAVVDTFAGLDSPDKIPAETRFQKYLHELEGMRATILRWNVRGFTPKQLDQLAAKLHAVTNAFRSTRKQQGRLPHGKDHGGLP
jgi:hypothetical protein